MPEFPNLITNTRFSEGVLLECGNMLPLWKAAL